MNKIIISGRLTKDPDIKALNSGVKVARFNLAVRKRVKKEGHPEADFFICSAFEKIAGLVELYCKKGDRIGVIGYVNTGKFTDKNNIERDRFEIIVEEIEFMSDTKSQNEQAAPTQVTPTQAAPEAPATELPFEI